MNQHLDLHSNKIVTGYMKKIGDEIVSKTGNEGDRYHLGKIILKRLLENPNEIIQIDGYTGKTETNISMARRSVALARAMLATGLQPGDVIVLIGPNLLDIGIPLYAGLFIGVAVMPLDNELSTLDLQFMLEIAKAKVVFCPKNRASRVEDALKGANLDSKIVTFGHYNNDLETFQDFYSGYLQDVDSFTCLDFDVNNTTALVICTSGSTGLPKGAELTHKNIAIHMGIFWHDYMLGPNSFPRPSRLCILFSTIQWYSGTITIIMSAIFLLPRVQSSVAVTPPLAYKLINKYKPTWLSTGPSNLNSLLNHPDRSKCDFKCFESVFVGGSALTDELFDRLRQHITKECYAIPLYGLSEVGIITTGHNYNGKLSAQCSGQPDQQIQIKLVNYITGDEVGVNEPGELWIKGESLFKGYYRNPEATKATFSEDGWFKTGDIMRIDQNGFIYFVDRIKVMFKYKHHQVSPVELETLLSTHPGVLEAGVCGIPDPPNGDIPAAAVVKKPKSEVTEQELEDFVKDRMTDTKRLRGGVIFVDKLPMTPSQKIDRTKLKTFVTSKICIKAGI